MLSYICLVWIFVSFIDHSNCYCSVSTIKGMITANCNNRSLRSVPNTLRDDLKIFEISHNPLVKIMSNSFMMYSSLHELRMTDSRIKFIDKTAFHGLESLNLLDLSRNELKDIPFNCLVPLKTLSELILDGNPIKQINTKHLEILQNLKELSMENCSITHIEVDFFKTLNKLKSLNLAGNKLTTLSKDVMPYLMKSEISFLNLNDNLWRCDCDLKWLRAWLVAAPIVWENMEGGPLCHDGVQKVVNKKWKNLNPDYFVCPITIIAVGKTAIECKTNMDATFECLVHGEPEPKIYWLRDGLDPIIQDSHFKTTLNKLWTAGTHESRLLSSAIIRNVTSNSIGDYVCVAENEYTKSEKVFSLVMPAQIQGYKYRAQNTQYNPNGASNLYDYSLEQDENQMLAIISLISVVLFAFICLIVTTCAIWRRKRWINSTKISGSEVDLSSKLGIVIETNEYSQVSGHSNTKPFYGGTASRVFPFCVSNSNLNSKIKKSQTTSTTVETTPSKSPRSKDTVPFYSVIFSDCTHQNNIKTLSNSLSNGKNLGSGHE